MRSLSLHSLIHPANKFLDYRAADRAPPRKLTQLNVQFGVEGFGDSAVLASFAVCPS